MLTFTSDEVKKCTRCLNQLNAEEIWKLLLKLNASGLLSDDLFKTILNAAITYYNSLLTQQAVDTVAQKHPLIQ